MIRIGFYTVACVVSLAISPAFAVDCIPPGPIEINVAPTTKDVQYDFQQTLADIQGQNLDTSNPYSFHSASFTQGLMKGAIRMEPAVKLSGFSEPDKGTACLWYNSIDLNIEIDPKIIIAKEVHDDHCTRKAVMEHEMKHVYVDRDIVNKYSEIIGNAVYDGLEARGGFVIGPIPVSQKEEAAKQMQDAVFDIIEGEYRKMERDRKEAQSQIDTLEEYDRVNAQCPDSQKKFSNLFRDHSHEH